MTGCPGMFIVNVVYWRSWTNLHPWTSGFLTGKTGSVTGANTRDNEVLKLVIFCYGIYALKGFLTYRVLINSEKRF